MTNLSNPLADQDYPLWKEISPTDTTFQIQGRFYNEKDDTYAVGKCIIGIGVRKNRTSRERAYINITSAPTLIDADNGVYEYSFASIDDRGIVSGNTSSLSLTTSADKRLRHKPSNTRVGIIVDPIYFAELENDFSSNTTSETISGGSGEAFDSGDQLSLHTDGKYYQYNSSTYPNWVGTALSTTTGVDEDFTIAYPGYEVDAYSGLTIGNDVYAEDTGDTTQTPSTTTKYIGYATSATKVKLRSTTPVDLKLTTKGDLIGYSTAPTRLGVGTDGQFLTADSSEATGLNWTSAGTEFDDSTFRIQDNGDATKEIAFQASGITTGTTRTITMPDENVDLGDIATLKNKVRASGYDGSITPSTSSDTQVTNYTESIDTGNDFASGVFTVPTTGNYQISWGGAVNSDANTRIRLRVDGSAVRTFFFSDYGGNINAWQQTDIIALTAGQTVDIVVQDSNIPYASFSSIFLSIIEL